MLTLVSDLESVRDCPICREDYSVDEVLTAMPCQHAFHPTCIEQWLRTSGTCPVWCVLPPNPSIYPTDDSPIVASLWFRNQETPPPLNRQPHQPYRQNPHLRPQSAHHQTFEGDQGTYQVVSPTRPIEKGRRTRTRIRRCIGCWSMTLIELVACNHTYEQDEIMR